MLRFRITLWHVTLLSELASAGRRALVECAALHAFCSRPCWAAARVDTFPRICALQALVLLGIDPTLPLPSLFPPSAWSVLLA